MNKLLIILLSFVFGASVCFLGQQVFLKKNDTFPHFHNKHTHKEILSPQQFFDYLKQKNDLYANFTAPKTLIIIVDSSLLDTLLKDYKTQQCKGWISDIYFLTDYPSVAFTKLGMTASLVTMGLEVAIAWGIKQAIFIGTMCAVQKDIAVGDLVVCQKAIRDEGTSHHYLPYGKYAYPSQKMLTNFLAILKDMKKPYKLGTILTTGAFFGMRVEEVKQYQQEGVLGVEAEMAGLLIVAAYRHIDMIAFGTRTDSYANLSWEKQSGYKEAKMKALKEFFEIALKVAKV